MESPPPLKKQRVSQDRSISVTNVAEQQQSNAITEKDAGIDTFLSTGAGFKALFKSRYTDFLVNEIDENGEVVHLTDLSVPESKALLLGPSSIEDVTKHLSALLSVFDNNEREIQNFCLFAQKQLEQLDNRITFTKLDLKESLENSSASLPFSTAFVSFLESFSFQRCSFQDLKKFIKKKVDKNTDNCFVFEKPNLDKEQRTLVHAAVFALFPWLDSDTVGVKQQTTGAEDKKFRCFLQSAGSLSRKAKQLEETTGEGNKNFLHFTMQKRGLSMAQAFSMLSRFLGVSIKSFSFCGSKDKRGVTVQRTCVYGVDAEKMRKAVLVDKPPQQEAQQQQQQQQQQQESKTETQTNKPAFIFTESASQDRALQVGNFVACSEPLHLGKHKGNFFRIVLRDIQSQSEYSNTNNSSHLQHLSREQLLHLSCLTLCLSGFLSFFGLQRFGSSQRESTDKVGLLLLQEKWKDAIALLLGPRSENITQPRIQKKDQQQRGDRDFVEEDETKAREIALSDPQTALKLMPRALVEERRLLSFLGGEAGAKQRQNNKNNNRKNINNNNNNNPSQPNPNATNYLGAFMSLPRQSLSLYLHAYQSLLFNKAVTARIELAWQKKQVWRQQKQETLKQQQLSEENLRRQLLLCEWNELLLPFFSRSLGEESTAFRFLRSLTENSSSTDLHPLVEYLCNSLPFMFAVEGDLVVEDSSASADSTSEAVDEKEADADLNFEEEDVDASDLSHKSKPNFVTKQQEANLTYSLLDIVLPIPGCEIILPANEIGAKLKQWIETDGSNLLNNQYMAKYSRDFVLPGGYRKLLCQAANLQWRLRNIDYPDQTLQLTDLQRLNGYIMPEEQEAAPKWFSLEDLQTTVESIFNSNSTHVASSETDNQKQLALLLRFSLPSSCYATMLLREITKQSSMQRNLLMEAQKLDTDSSDSRKRKME